MIDFLMVRGRGRITGRKPKVFGGPLTIIPPRKTKPTPTRKPIVLRLDPELVGELDSLAQATGYTRHKVIVFLIRWALPEAWREAREGKGINAKKKR